MTREIQVHVDLPEGHAHAGDLVFDTNVGGALVATTFRYRPAWLAHPDAYTLSPELAMSTAPQRAMGLRPIPGAVADTGPDRWGRTLLFDAERRAARDAGRPLPVLSDADVILLADDRTRLGNLRYVDPETGEFLSPPRDGLPTLVDLPRLVMAAQRASARQQPDDAGLRLLVAGGTTLGGARPKVNVALPSGALAVAKLPAADDRWDVQAWEATTLHLARDAGLRVPRFELHRTGPETSVLVLDRFDRSVEGRRIGFMSADTLLEKAPDDAASYVDLVDALGDLADDARNERAELFRRVAFVLLVNDVDDHMKNHALLRGARGWRLSPVFDVNPWPVAWATQSTPLSPGGQRTDRSVEELVENAPAFGLDHDAAVRVVLEVEHGTRGWAEVAERYGIEDRAGGVLSTAFDNPNRERVLAWRDRPPPMPGRSARRRARG